ncbi:MULTISPECIES: LpxL/LpxP family acyltransferase [unclassified Halorhodospira]|uniref:LpxL/LpxP family acyltransferase n=1 Tax=unclassified Halorhodospira TaxID=2626748 RepID=UPI001EE811BF|nr:MULTISPECIES: lipid A biosynthesis acyltransferase [unclassified Halorhodospira]MCG5540244.1 lipid A biosynthesis acyltransferase [Halorhodospira sp. M39old]MCG5545055.1 lipid A biosynthesis acyltransferase [Halorhodospira sp. M38]
MTGQWQNLQERGSPLALRTIRWIALRVGRPFARSLLPAITLYFLLTAGHARQASRQFLRRAGFERPHLGHVFRHFYTFAAVILDRVYFTRGDLQRFDLRLHIDPGVRDHLDGGHGALMLGAHFGSFDALRAVGLQYGDLRLRVLMHYDSGQLIVRLLDALNPQMAQTVIPLGTPQTLLRTKEWLDDGGTVALLGDRLLQTDDPSRRRTVNCHFMGHPTRMPTGPLHLAARTRKPIILFFGIYRGGNRYDIHLEWLVGQDEVDRIDAPETVQRVIQRYADRLEAHARNAPYNWFNFYDYWRNDELDHD